MDETEIRNWLEKTREIVMSPSPELTKIITDNMRSALSPELYVTRIDWDDYIDGPSSIDVGLWDSLDAAKAHADAIARDCEASPVHPDISVFAMPMRVNSGFPVSWYMKTRPCVEDDEWGFGSYVVRVDASG